MLGSFLRKAVYGLIGNACAMLAGALGNFRPAGDAVDVYVWQGLAVGVFTGLTAIGKRLAVGK